MKKPKKLKLLTPSKSSFKFFGNNLGNWLSMYLQINADNTCCLLTQKDDVGDLYSNYNESVNNNDFAWNFNFGFNFSNDGEIYNLMHDIGIIHELKIKIPTNRFVLYEKNNYFLFNNNIKKYHTQLVSRHLVDAKNIKNLLNFLHHSYDNFEYFESASKKYKYGINVLEHYLSNKRTINEFSYVAFANATTTKEIHPAQFIFLCCQYYWGEMGFWNDKNNSLQKIFARQFAKDKFCHIKYDQMKIIKSKSSWQVDPMQQDLKKFDAKKVFSGFGFASTKQQLKVDFNEVYPKLHLDNAKKRAFCHFIIGFKQSSFLHKMKEKIIIINEYNTDFDIAADVALGKTILEIKSELSMSSIFGDSNNVFVIRFLRYLDDHLKYNDVEKIITKRFLKYFPKLEQSIIFKKFFNQNDFWKMSHLGKTDNFCLSMHPKIFLEAVRVPQNNKFFFTGVNNIIGPSLEGQVRNCIFNFQIAQAIVKKNTSLTSFDQHDCREILEYLSRLYRPVAKYYNTKIGYTIDYQYHFQLVLTPYKCILKEVNFEEVCKSTVYVWAITPIIKQWIQKKKPFYFLVFTNKIRIRGGVFFYRKIMRKCFPGWSVEWKRSMPNYYNSYIKKENVFNSDKEAITLGSLQKHKDKRK